MKFSREQILHIARLARLHLEESEIEQYRNDLGSILEYVEKLQELNTDDVPEFQHAASGTNVFRDDLIDRCEEDIRKRVIENFSAREDDLLQVQAIFANRTE